MIPSHTRGTVGLAPTLCGAIALSFFALLSAPASAAPAKHVEIYFIDVEGGQSTLIVTPARHTLLIDTGFSGDGKGFNPGDPHHARDANRILAAAREAGVDHIDELLITHFHQDHDGGVAELSKLLPIRTFVDHGSPHAEVAKSSPANADAFRAYAAVRSKGKHIEPRPGARLPLNDVEAIVVSSAGATISDALTSAGAANPACAAHAIAPQDTLENPRSTGIVLRYGKFRFLDVGDLSGEPLFNLACPKDMIGPVDVYLVAHHGGADVADAATFAAFKPRVAIMNNGKTKGGERETYEALHHVAGLEDVWQLHASDAAAERNFPAEYIANVDESTAHWIKIVASEDGSFEVFNPRTGSSKKYAARSPDATRTSAVTENPFMKASTLPYRFPPFDRIKDSDYRPAFDAGMSEELREVAAIAHDSQAPTFDNTIVALERTGQLLERVTTVFDHLNQCNTNDEMQKIDTEMAPKRAAHEDAILLDPALYARIDSLYQRRASLGLDAESLQLLERYHTQFVRAGAGLPDASKARLRALNEQLSSLTTQFKQNVLKATKERAVVVDSVAELQGLSAEQIGAAASAAAARGLTGKWLITLQNTTSQPLLAQLTNRQLREKLYRASIERGTSGDADNTPVIAQLVKLRAERAALLGYPNHAAYRLADESAETPQAVDKMLGDIAPVALARAKADAADMQKLIDAEAKASGSKPFALQAWDWPFYAEKLRKARYDFDQSQVAPYFELNRVLQDGVFYAAHELYGLTFKERTDLPLYRPDLRVFEVFDADGSPLALFIGDYFARDNKGGGAWMNSYVKQSKLFGLKPVVANHLNIPKPPAGQPVLLTFDEVTTLFHEFGHAIHGMLSDVRYPLLSGTAVPRDFVEYPSQYNEMWAREPAVLAHFARHYKTGEAMPKVLLDKVLAAQKFDQGYATTEYLEAAMVDQAWHQISVTQAPAAKDVAAFEAAALRKSGLDYPAVPPRYHSAYFSHIFAGGYASSYYAYLWSEVLARDTGQWFHEHGGLSRANGAVLREKVLSRGRSADPERMFREFYGRAPEVGPLLEYRGLAGTARQ